MQMDNLNFAYGWWIAWFGAALLVFLYLQAYMNDPERQRKNDEWFAQFSANLAERYRDPALAWRAHAMEQHFHFER